MSIRTFICLLLGGITIVVGAESLRAEESASLAPEIATFFKKHCTDCHDAEAKDGNLDLAKLDPAFGSRESLDQWTRIFDRVSRHEMPPAKSPQPDADEIRSMLAALEPVLAKADRAQRETVQRRLNRIEYQNTIHDLLGIDIELLELLPEDQQAGGFDNNGEALAVSTEQMQGYLEAARRAIDAAIIAAPDLAAARPKTETFTVDSVKETKQYFGQGVYDFVDGRVVVHQSSDNSEYSKVSTRDKRVPVRGRYRIKFEAATFASPKPLCFTFTTSTFQSQGITQRNLGYYEVGANPQTFEIEAVMEARGALQFFPLGLPTWINKKPGVVYAGVGFGPVEITGPLVDVWPPESHTRLLAPGGSKLVDLNAGTIDDARRVLAAFVPRAFRRQVTEDEVRPYVDLVAARLAAGRTFYESLRAALVGVLCSPKFLYLNEEAATAGGRIGDVEFATRLAYFLWSAPPDEELLVAAAAQKLREPEVLKSQVERMLKSVKSESFVRNFTGQWLKLRLIGETTPDAKLYPKFDELLQESMVWESEGFFRELLRDDLPLRDLLDSRWAMLNERLATHYGIPGVEGLKLRKVSLPEGSVRGGVLTQGAVLKVTANGTTTSPVLRGVWVLENILGEPAPPPPPPNTAGIEPDIRGAQTVREQLAKHRNDASCNVCHRSIDPPGFALESFDPTGAYRENYLRWKVTNAEHNWGSVEKAAKVDASGETAGGDKFADIRDFKKLLLKHDADFAACLTEKLATYALGREMGFGDRDAIEEIAARARNGNNGLRTLIHELVRSELFAAK